jgi:hypothetical protein
MEDEASWNDLVRMGLDYGIIPDYATACRMFEEVLGVALPVPGAEYAKLPPGFVKTLFGGLQAFPTLADFDDSLGGVTEEVADEAGRITRSVARRASGTDRLVAQTSEVVIRALLETRKRLATQEG